MNRLTVFLSALLALLAFQGPAFATEPDAKPADAKHDAKKDKDDGDDEIEATHGPVTYTIDVDLESLSKFELGAGTVHAEFVLTVHCDHAPCKPQLEIGNGKLVGKAEKIGDEPLEKKFRMKAELDAFIDLSAYPYDSHELQLELYEKHDPFQTSLKVGTFEANDRLRLPGWNIDDHPHVAIEKIDAGDKKKQDQYVFAMSIERPKMAQTFKSLVPVFFMLLVAAVGLALRPKSVNVRFAASTGGIVPLVMFHVGQISSLPTVGYLTRLDKIMVASYFAFLVHIVFNLLMVRAEEVKDEARSARLYKIAGITVPVLTIVLWVVAMVL